MVAVAKARLRSPLRVGMVVTYDFARPGGVKHHAEHLAAALRRGGDEVTLIAPSSRPHADAITFDGIANVPANGSDNQLGLFVSPPKIARYFAEHPFDVIHVHEPLQPALSYWSVWASRSTPHVATFHAYSEDEGRALRAARKVFGKAIFPWFQRAIAVSEPAARYASAAWTRSLDVIPNGVATDMFMPLRAPRTPGPFRFLFVGRLADDRKGARHLLDAWQSVRGAELDIVGDVGAFPMPDLPNVRVHGAVGLGTLVELYRNCDAFVAPATGQESFGIVLLEAMASGKPVICSDIDGYREVARGSRARLVPPADPRALAVAMNEVKADHHLGSEGELNRRHALAYDWRRIAESVRATYLEAMR